MGLLDFDKLATNPLVNLGLGLLANSTAPRGTGTGAMLGRGALMGMENMQQAQQAQFMRQMQQRQLQELQEQEAAKEAQRAYMQNLPPEQQQAMVLGVPFTKIWEKQNPDRKPQLVELADPKDPLRTVKQWMVPGEQQGTQIGYGQMPEILDPRVQEARRSIAKAGASNQVVNNIMPKGDSKYVETRLEGRAKELGELGKAAKSAYGQLAALDRFVENSEKGFAGSAAPVMSGVTNFLASFGYAPESLKNTQLMQQAVGDILGNKMSELGARGLTDKDMEVLKQALPRIDSDKESRVQIAKVLAKTHLQTLNEYDAAVEGEVEAYPDLKSRIPVAPFMKDYQRNKANYGRRFGVQGQSIGGGEVIDQLLKKYGN